MTSVDELVTWLRAQLDGDERVATDAARGQSGRWVQLGDGFGEGAVETTEHDIVAYDEGSPSVAEAEHIARWDPARVLAEVDAKRRILELHAPFMDHAGRVRCEHCSELCHSRSGLGCDDPADAMYPCDTARLLALPYAGRDGYREEWRP